VLEEFAYFSVATCRILGRRGQGQFDASSTHRRTLSSAYPGAACSSSYDNRQNSPAFFLFVKEKILPPKDLPEIFRHEVC